MSFCDVHVQELKVMRPLNYKSTLYTHTGLVVMNAELKSLANTLLIGKVPKF